MATPAAAITVQPALLFMPDISGFTDFVNTNEIMHAQAIVQEVLEVIIESNKLKLEVNEIEGDAVFFYRIGEPPTTQQLLEQVQSMYTKFHHHLKQYDHSRICPCGACTTAKDLKLKFIVHYGEVAGYSIKQHQKLFGKDVIVVHRLLKNNLNKKEYALLTKQVLKDDETFPSWFTPEEASEQYDVGEINFKIADLSPLYANLPEPPLPVYDSYLKAKVAFTEEKIVQANIFQIFGAIFDILQRPKWMDGVKGVEMVTKDNVNRVGTKHKCIVGKNSPIMVTESADLESDRAELVEMDEKGMGGCRFVIKKISEHESKVQAECLVRNNFLARLMFNLLFKNKYQQSIRKSLQNLQHYCNPSLN